METEIKKLSKLEIANLTDQTFGIDDLCLRLEKAFTQAHLEHPDHYINLTDLAFVLELEQISLSDVQKAFGALLRAQLEQGIVYANKRGVGYRVANDNDVVQEVCKSIIRSFGHIGNAMRKLHKSNINLERVLELDPEAFRVIEPMQSTLDSFRKVMASVDSGEIKHFANKTGLVNEVGVPGHMVPDSHKNAAPLGF